MSKWERLPADYRGALMEAGEIMKHFYAMPVCHRQVALDQIHSLNERKKGLKEEGSR